MSDNVALICLVEGDSKEKAFKVIAGINDVNDLREKIKGKKPNLFVNTDANDIVMWKVNISIKDDDMEIDVSLKNIQDKSKLSHPTRIINNMGSLLLKPQYGSYDLLCPVL